MISDYDKVMQILKKYNIRDLEEIEYGKDCFDELNAEGFKRSYDTLGDENWSLWLRRSSERWIVEIFSWFSRVQTT